MERTMMAEAAIHLTPEDLSEWPLVERCQEGDEGAFKVLVERYQRRATRLAYGFVSSRDDSKDIVQDAFVRAFKSMKELRSESQFYTWFCGILVDVALDHLRRNETPTQSCESNPLLRDQISSGSQLECTDPHDEIWRRQRRKAIVRAIDSLPVDERMTIILREIGELSYEEIGQFTRVPIGTVMSWLLHARRRLQVKLGEFADRPARLSL